MTLCLLVVVVVVVKLRRIGEYRKKKIDHTYEVCMYMWMPVKPSRVLVDTTYYLKNLLRLLVGDTISNLKIPPRPLEWWRQKSKIKKYEKIADFARVHLAPAVFYRFSNVTVDETDVHDKYQQSTIFTNPTDTNTTNWYGGDC